MKDNTVNYEAPEHHTPTVELVEKYESCTNPVTRGAYRSIIAARLGITERQELSKKANNRYALEYLEKCCTYSFDGRQKMRALFELWFMK